MNFSLATRKADVLGRVVLPREIRKSLNISENTPLTIFANDEGQIIIQKKEEEIRYIDELGRIALPFKIRQALGITDDTLFKISVNIEGNVIIEKELQNIYSTNMFRSTDECGRVILPKEIRNRFNITANTAFKISTDDEGNIILKKEIQNISSANIIRKADLLGRIVLPKAIRNHLNITENTPLEIFTADEGKIILKRH